MKKRCLLGILALSTLAATAQPSSLHGAKVTRLKGQVQVKQSSVWRLLKEGEQLAESTLVKLAQGSHLSLRYRHDGHREEAEGPGQMIIGKGGLTGAGKLESFGFKNRPLEVPRSGGLDAVGGAVANANPMPMPVATLHPGAPITHPVEMTPDPVPDGGSSTKIPRLRNGQRGLEKQYPIAVELPEPLPMTLAFDSNTPQLVAPNSGPFRVGGFQGQAVLFEGDTEVTRLPVAKDQSLDLTAYAVNPDSLYRVALEEEGLSRGSMTFRVLEPEEARELLELTLETEVPVERRLERMDRFSDLGQFHRAAEEGSRWLKEAHTLEQPEETAAVLQLVYDINRDMLHDASQTAYWAEWAELNQLPLIR